MTNKLSRATTWPEERRFLTECAINLPGEYIVEIGSFYGQTTATLAKAIDGTGRKVIAIDPWSGYYSADENVYRDFCDTIEPYSDVVSVYRMTSAEFPLPNYLADDCALVFIDGDHAGDAAYRDAVKFWPCVKNGGVMAWHDYYDAAHGTDVQAAVERFMRETLPSQIVHTFRHFPTAAELRERGAKEMQGGMAWVIKTE